MSLTCTRCEGTGFLNIDQVDDNILKEFHNNGDVSLILNWIDERNNSINSINNGHCFCAATLAPCPVCELFHDVQVCDCCGDGEDWYGDLGEYYTENDPMGMNGPYAYNGGLRECN